MFESNRGVFHMTKLLLATAVAAVSFATVAPASAATLTASATNPFTGGTAGGVRYRAFDLSPPPSSQREIFVGRHDLGVGGNRAERDASYAASNSFALSYDAGTDVLTASLNGTSQTFANAFGGLNASFNGKPLNRLSFIVRDGSDGQQTLSDLLVNGTSFDGLSSTNGITYYTTTGNFRNSFSVSGTLGLTGPFTAGAEGDSLQVLVGNAVPEPAAWAMMIGGFGLAGAAMRRRSATQTVLA
jgi:hypothetical protein